MKIAVLGTGYVGLVAGACFSDSGNEVICVDVNPDVIAKLKVGTVPIFEPGLDEIVERNAKARRLTFTTSSKEAIANSEVVFIAVGTPQDEDGSADLKYVLKAAETIRESAIHPMVVVLKSTVPVGTADRVREVFVGATNSFEVVSNPEFLKEGAAIQDFLKPERVVVGCASDKAWRVMEQLYLPFVRSGSPILRMSNRSAELSKYAANGFLATKVSFINSMALLAEKVGADIHDVRKALTTDSRIGSKFLYPGCGYGGSCFPKDVQALIHLADSAGHTLEILKAVHKVNDQQKKVLFEKMQKFFGASIQGKTIAVWGLAFKPMTDDIREAPALELIGDLLKVGAQVKAYDPVAMEASKRVFESKIEWAADAYSVAEGADALAILTEWNEFRVVDLKKLHSIMRGKAIFDGRNIFSPDTVSEAGFHYFGIGRLEKNAAS